MTAPNTPLVERVAEAIRHHEHIINGMPFRSILPIEEARGLAQAAIDACRAEEMQRVIHGLLAAIKGQPVIIFTEGMVDAVETARVLLAKLEPKQ